MKESLEKKSSGGFILKQPELRNVFFNLYRHDRNGLIPN